MNSWRYALGEFRRRPGRSLLSLLSVVIAVTAVVAISSATATTRTATRKVYELLSGRADLEVVSKGGSQFPEEETKQIAALPHVRTVVPVLRRGTNVFRDHKKISVLVSGIVPSEPESVAGLKMKTGALPSGAGEVAVEENLAANLDVKTGEELKFFTGRMQTYKVSGIFGLENAAQLQQGGMLIMPLERMQRIFSAPPARSTRCTSTSINPAPWPTSLPPAPPCCRRRWRFACRAPAAVRPKRRCC